MIFALNSIAFEKFEEERDLLYHKAKNIYVITMNKKIFREILILIELQSTAIFLQQYTSEIYHAI